MYLKKMSFALWFPAHFSRSFPSPVFAVFFIRRSAIYNAGSVPLLAKLIKLDKQDFLIPFVGLAQECAVEVSF